MSEGDVELRTSDGLSLRGWWRRAEGAATTVVIAHGFSAGGEEVAISGLADDLQRAGFDVLTYDARGHGASEGRSGVGSTEHLDVACAAGVATRAGRPVVLVGVSMGAVAIVSHLATVGLDLGRVVGAVLVSGPARWTMPVSPVGLAMAGLTRTPLGRWVAERFLRVRIAHGWRVGEEPAMAIGRVDLPVAIIHGTGDRLLSVAHGRILHEAAGGPCRLQLVEGMSHGINAASLPATVDAIAWVLHAAGIRAPTTRPAR